MCSSIYRTFKIIKLICSNFRNGLDRFVWKVLVLLFITLWRKKLTINKCVYLPLKVF